MMRIFLVAVLLAACADDGVRHTPDATNVSDDAAGDGAVDAPVNPAMLSASPGDTDFGDVVIGQTTATVTYTISNDGDAPSGTLGVFLDSATAGFAVSDNHCSGISLAMHETCTVAVAFTPAVAGLAMTMLHVGASPGGDVARGLTGNGLQPGAIDITEASHDFVSLAVDATQPASHTFTVKNTGQVPTGVPMPSVTGSPNTYSVASTTCSAALAPMTTCTVVVHFDPKTVGSKPGSLVVTASPGGSDSATLAGIGNARVAVTKTGNGTGTVTSNVAGIACGSACTTNFDVTPVTLTAAPDTGATFGGWMGDCSGTGTCTLDLTAGKTATAAFTLKRFALTTSTAGNGAGTVTGAGTYNYGTQVTVTQTPAPGSTFTGWGGACSGMGACVVTMTSAQSVIASYTLQQFVLTTSTTGNGSGTMTGAGTYDYGTQVTLTESPAAGSTFAGWGGACSGTGACVVTMTQARTVTASFTLQQFTLTTSTNGAGSGTVTGAGTYNYGTVVTLSESPGTGSVFGGWGGTCSGTGGCSVTMTTNRAVSATFNVQQLTLTTSHNGTGSGTITGAGTYAYGTVVTVTESPATGSTFGGWGGDCSGTGGCSVTMTANRAVSADFDAIPETLSVTTGAPNGVITSMPAGINCRGTTCTHDFDYGALVTLNATPDTGYRVAVVAGDCTAMPCTVTMDQARSVTVRFAAQQFTFSLGIGGDAPGSVTVGSSTYSASTSFTVSYGQQLTLTQSHQSDWFFFGWGGACASNGTASTCTLTIAGDTSATATFMHVGYSIDLTATTQTATGIPYQVSYPTASNPGQCSSSTTGTSCSGWAGTLQTVDLVAHPPAGAVFQWNDLPTWTGCDSVSADRLTCTIKITGTRTVTVTGDLR